MIDSGTRNRALPGPCLRAHSLQHCEVGTPESVSLLLLRLLLNILCVTPVLGGCCVRLSDTELVVTMGKMLEATFQMNLVVRP